jgi:hypothetical protein
MPSCLLLRFVAILACLRLPRPACLQIVRDFLLHGPVTIAGVEYCSLAAYYVVVTKRIQKRHHCNVAELDVTKAIMSPTLLVNGLILNQTLACVCDAVHWGLTNFSLKRCARSNKTSPWRCVLGTAC